jgi:hypothetical protein
MQRFSMLARHVIGLVALALAVLTFGSGSLVSTTAGHSGGDKGKVVAANGDGKMRSSVTGTTEDGREIKAGRFTPESFSIDGETLMVTGTLEGAIPGEGRFSETVTAPVESVSTTGPGGGSDLQLVSNHNCDILNLVLGPLDLNLLGLEVHLDTVVLDIVATPGPGNLLGNLLCAVAGLLDGVGGGGLGALLNDLIALLEDILAQLGL